MSFLIHHAATGQHAILDLVAGALMFIRPSTGPGGEDERVRDLTGVSAAT